MDHPTSPRPQHRLLVLTETMEWKDSRPWCPPCSGELQSGPMTPVRWCHVLTLREQYPGPAPPLPRRS
jgi:hypothetical protein